MTTIEKIAEFELGMDDDYIKKNIEVYENKTYDEVFSGENYNDQKKEMFGTEYFHGEIIENEFIVEYVAVQTKDKTLVVKTA